MSQKYEISEIAHPRYPWLHRIRALSDVRPGVQKGDLGGYVQSAENLSQEGSCWIFDDAIACDESFVDQQATVSGSAVVCGSALVSGKAMIRHTTVIDDHAIVMAGFVGGHAHVAGNAAIAASTITGAWPHIEDFANVYGDICGLVFVKGNAVILPGVSIDNPTPDTFVIDHNKMMVERSYQRLNGIPLNPNKQQKTNGKSRFEPER